MDNPFGIVTLIIVSANDVPIMDIGGKSDPYCVIKYANKKIQTQVDYKTLNPVWNFQTRMLLTKSESNYSVEIELWDHDKITRDKYIATCEWSFSEIISLPSKEFTDFTLEFVPELGKRKKILNKIKKTKKTGVLNIRAAFHPINELERYFWEEVVKFCDDDGSNTIDAIELRRLIQSLVKLSSSPSLSHASIEDLFNAMDKNKDGVLSIDEICEFMCDRSNIILQSLWPNRDIAILQICTMLLDGSSVNDIIVDNFEETSVEQIFDYFQSSNTSKQKKIIIHNRKTGKLEVELMPSYLRVTMRLMYKNRLGKKATSRSKVKKILKHMTVRQGTVYSDPSSVKNIQPFIEFHKLDIDEILDPLDSFTNFNEFFYRKLKAGARITDCQQDQRVVVSPADCRLHVFPTVDRAKEIWIKGENFTISQLVVDSGLAEVFENASVLIARLAPQDYHRFHSPVDGILNAGNLINGGYYTVNPIAVTQKSIDVFCENKRYVTTIQTEHFGLICFIAVGATMVGSINITASPGLIAKGEELGYFAFGGSTCIVLFQQNKVKFDDDLLENSNRGTETLVQVGNRVAVSLR